MDSCSRCGVQTELYYGGVPLCPKCSELGEAKRKPQATAQQIRNTLLQDVFELTAKAVEATREFETVMGQIPSDLPHPDGTQRIKNASAKLSIARKELMKAHSRLVEHFTDKIVRSG